MLLMSKRRTLGILFALLYALILISSWNLLRSVFSWYGSTNSPSTGVWPAVWAVFGLLSMASAAALAVPAMLVTWITVVVLLACCGRQRKDLLADGKQLTADIFRSVLKSWIREGNLVAAAFAVVGYLLLVGNGRGTGNGGFALAVD